MKKVLLPTLAMMLLLFTACSSDDDGGVPIVDASAVVGTWNMAELNDTVTQTIGVDGFSFTTVGISDWSNINVMVTFGADGSLTSTGTADLTVTSTTDGGSPTVTDAGTQNLTWDGSYSIAGGNMVMQPGATVESARTGTYRITELTNNLLVLEADDQIVEQNDFTTVMADVRIVFTR